MMHDDTAAEKMAANPPTTRTGQLDASNESVMREPVPTREDLHRHAAVERDRAATIKAMVITMAIVIAPFLALVFGIEFALGVLAAGLAFTTVVTWSGARRVNPALRFKLQIAAGLNAMLLIAILIVLLLKLAA